MRSSAAAVATAVAALISWPPGAAAATTELDFHAYAGGLPVARGTLRLTLGDGGASRPYAVRLDAGSASWITVFTTFHYEAEASGTLANPSLRPERFRSERKLRRKHDVTRGDFSGAVPRVQTEPPMNPEDAVLVPDDAKRGSADPLSVAAAVVAAAGSAAACGGRFPVYDGRRRYDVLLKPLGREVLAPSSRRMAAGPADACEVTLRPVAGFQMDVDPEKFFARGVDRTAKVWFMPVQPGGRAVPMQVEVETRAGTVYVHTTAVRERP